MKKNQMFRSSNIIILLFLVLIAIGGGLYARQNRRFYMKVRQDKNITSIKNLREGLSNEKMADPFKLITGVVDKKILRKKEAADFTYYEIGDNDYAVLKTKEFSDKEIKKFVKNTETIYQKAIDGGAQFLYINTPSRLRDDYKKKLENVDYQEINDDRFLNSLDKDIPVLDLRKSERINQLQNVYYKTDHHFTIEATFEAYKETIESFRELYNDDLDEQGVYSDISNYEKLEKKNVFSGSTRQNIGGAYEEKEDYRIFVPKYDTSFAFEHYDAKEELTLEGKGPFLKSLCDMKIFDDDSILNKYNVFLSGANTETIIKNNNAPSNKKLLVLSTSFARSYVPYMAQCFAETRFLDPQAGRYEKSVIKYIEDYNPDTVIVMNETYTAFNVES